jgi:hypothetical protein
MHERPRGVIPRANTEKSVHCASVPVSRAAPLTATPAIPFRRAKSAQNFSDHRRVEPAACLDDHHVSGSATAGA